MKGKDSFSKLEKTTGNTSPKVNKAWKRVLETWKPSFSFELVFEQVALGQHEGC